MKLESFKDFSCKPREAEENRHFRLHICKIQRGKEFGAGRPRFVNSPLITNNKGNLSTLKVRKTKPIKASLKRNLAKMGHHEWQQLKL